MDAEDVNKVQFRKPPGGARGYEVDEVDSFLDLVADRLLTNNQLTADAVRRIAFKQSRPGAGYNKDEVDDFLDQVEAALSGLEGGQSAGAFTAKTAAAGWYSDPGGSDRSRYFDGTRWTNKYRGQSTARSKSWWRQPAFGRLSLRTAVIIVMGLFVVGIGMYEYFNPFGEPKLTYLQHVQDFTHVEPRCSNSTKPYSCFSRNVVEDWEQRYAATFGQERPVRKRLRWHRVRRLSA